MIRALRRLGYEGGITLVGAEPHLPYDRPPLSKEFLADETQAAPRPLEPEAFYDDVELRLGVRARALVPSARRVELSDGSAITADHVVVATGSTARWLPGLEAMEGLFTLRTIEDAQGIRAALDQQPRVVVVGGGFIGCEVAASARARGLDVTVVEPLAAPVVRGVGPVIGARLAAVHRGRGVDLRLGTGVASVEGGGRVREVILSDGSKLPADLVVVGVGAVPETAWLEGSGVTLDGGVVCDAHCRVAGGGGHVWAVGDVARWPSRLFGEAMRIEHWTNAVEQAGVAAANLLGDVRPYDPVPYVWSDQYDVKVQVLGLVAGEDDVEPLNGAVDDERFVAGFFRDGILRGVVGFSWPRAVMSYRTLLAGGAGPAQAREHAATLG